MGEYTKIGWCNHTWNPWWGCVEVSPACDNCYARTFSHRMGFDVWGSTADRRFFEDKHWNEPVRWNQKAAAAGEQRRVFCASMADVFERHPDKAINAKLTEARFRLFALIEMTPHLTWLILTKRPSNALEMLPLSWRGGFPRNFWFGITAEDNYWLNIRAAYAEQVEARVRFISWEPSLGPLTDLEQFVTRYGTSGGMRGRLSLPNDDTYSSVFQWVIAGGERGGSQERASRIEWFRQARNICQQHGTAFFLKQWGDHNANLIRVGHKEAGAQLDGRVWEQVPA